MGYHRDKDRARKMDRARYAAMKRLAQKHQYEFDQLYLLALKSQGITNTENIGAPYRFTSADAAKARASANVTHGPDGKFVSVQAS